MARSDLARLVKLDQLEPTTLAALDALKDGVHYRSGTCRRIRPVPRDFAEMFVRLGWGRGITEHYGCNDRSITRWIEECGGDKLRAKRSAVTGQPFTRRRSKYPTYAEAVAAIVRGEEVPAIPRHVPKGRTQRIDEPLYVLALDRGYRVKRAGFSRSTGEPLYRINDRRDQRVRSAAAVDDLMAWLENQPPVQW